MVTAKKAAEIVYNVFPERCGITGYNPTSTKDELNYEITIHFPEILISNSKKQKHIIKDLFVKIKVVGGQIKEFSGTRTTLNAVEIHHNYNHSHMSQSGFGIWGAFCTGSSFVRELLSAPLTEDNLWALFFNLEAFVSHESIEGRPYRYINSLTGDDLSNIQNPYDAHSNPNLTISGARLINEHNVTRSSDFISDSLIDAFSDYLQMIVRKNSDNEDSINLKDLMENHSVDNFIREAAENKNLIFDDLEVFGFSSNANGEKKMSSVSNLWGQSFLVQGDLIITTQKDSSNQLIEINPKILVLQKLNSDLSITEVVFPAIKYFESDKKTKKPQKNSGEYKTLNIGSGIFEKVCLQNKLGAVYHEMMQQNELYNSSSLFLNNLI